MVASACNKVTSPSMCPAKWPCSVQGLSSLSLLPDLLLHCIEAVIQGPSFETYKSHITTNITSNNQCLNSQNILSWARQSLDWVEVGECTSMVWEAGSLVGEAKQRHKKMGVSLGTRYGWITFQKRVCKLLGSVWRKSRKIEGCSFIGGEGPANAAIDIIKTKF